ncbi:MAG: carbohydrate-binding domain-containing protein [Anaerolineae bacterium]|nr:carbohydrate-binding domain-containing protein [Anaerolineae bacterium]
MFARRVCLLAACALAATMIVACDVGTDKVLSQSASVENVVDHADSDDFAWDSADVTEIALNDNNISIEGEGALAEGNHLTVTSAGTYRLSGTLTDGQIIVDTEEEALVRLILGGVTLSSSTSAPINIVNAEETVIVLESGSQNSISDGAVYVFESAGTDEPNAAIFSKTDLTFYGDGALTVAGNFNDGITSKDGLVIAGGSISVNAVDDGIRGKDYLVIEGGTVTVNAGGDGLKSDNEEDAARGYISISAGAITVTASGDAITAQTDVLIAGGEFTLMSGGGSAARLDGSVSAKGVKSVISTVIDGGVFTINSADDSVHSNSSIVINGGTFALSTGDDAVHADATVVINGGEIRITDSYEGIESAIITINGGDIHVVSSDDGVNVANGVDGSGMGGRPGRGVQQTTFTGSTYLYINGGTIVVDADGDGIDVNGAVEMTGGVVIVNGPTEQMNGALDYDASFVISGGFLVAAGSSGMAQAPGEGSSQNSLLVNVSSTLPAGTLVHIQDSSGNDLLTFAPTKSYQSIAFSSAALVTGSSYAVYFGGSAEGRAVDGLYQEAAYSGGTESATFTASGAVTMLGQSVRRR